MGYLLALAERYTTRMMMVRRVAVGVDKLKTGIIVWAQNNERDDIYIEENVNLHMYELIGHWLFFIRCKN